MVDVVKLTEGCPREDCSISFGAGMSTCMAWTPMMIAPTYNKKGERTDQGDPNIHTSSAVCSACGKRWSICQQRGETTVTLHEDQPRS
jgi:hypothetical protein